MVVLGTFSYKSAYDLQGVTANSVVAAAWKQVWEMRSLTQYLLFVWLVRQRGLKTNEGLFRRVF